MYEKNGWKKISEDQLINVWKCENAGCNSYAENKMDVFELDIPVCEKCNQEMKHFQMFRPKTADELWEDVEIGKISKPALLALSVFFFFILCILFAIANIYFAFSSSTIIENNKILKIIFTLFSFTILFVCGTFYMLSKKVENK